MTAQTRPTAAGLAAGLAITAVSALLAAVPAAAADLPARRAPLYAPPPPIPVFSWTGFYVGAQVGYEFGRSNGTIVDTGTDIGFDNGSASKNGVIGGVHLGYLYSTQSLPVVGSFFGSNGAFGLGTGGVIGIEGDVDGTTARANTTYPFTGLVGSAREDVVGSLRGRLGIAFDRALFYATGGGAFGSLRNGYVFNPGGVVGNIDTSTHTRIGYTVGGGVEYSFTNNLSARVEYRYTDFGSYVAQLSNISGGTAAVRQRETDNRVQAGVSYRFETIAPAPVVARY